MEERIGAEGSGVEQEGGEDQNGGGEAKEREKGDEEKRRRDLAVFNLGVEGLSADMEDVLSLGLKFVPVQKVNKSKVEADVERLKVRLMWDVYWKW